jgi:hypothetical protein
MGISDMIPKTKLEKLELCRFVCGSNPFVGISHFTKSRDMFFSNYYHEPVKIAEIMSYLMEEFGVNAIISSPRDEIYAAIQIVEKELGQKFHWICTPSGRATAKDISDNIYHQIQWCVDHHVSVCMPHRSYTDSHYLDGRIDGIEPILAKIRDSGMIPGLSTHYHEVIRIVKDQKYDVKLIIQPVNTISFQSNIEINTLCEMIQSTKIQILAIKPMAAGRLLPEAGLPFSLSNIKPNDFITAGFASLEDADYDAQIIEKWFQKYGNSCK